jgi:hypothetical protein
MATAARAAKRRSTRKDENGAAGPAQGGPSPVEPPEPQEGQEQVAGVFVRVTGTGKYQVEVQPLGDTRVTELETLLKLALGRAKEMVRLDD